MQALKIKFLRQCQITKHGIDICQNPTSLEMIAAENQTGRRIFKLCFFEQYLSQLDIENFCPESAQQEVPHEKFVEIQLIDYNFKQTHRKIIVMKELVDLKELHQIQCKLLFEKSLNLQFATKLLDPLSSLEKTASYVRQSLLKQI